MQTKGRYFWIFGSNQFWLISTDPQLIITYFIALLKERANQYFSGPARALFVVKRNNIKILSKLFISIILFSILIAPINNVAAFSLFGFGSGTSADQSNTQTNPFIEPLLSVPSDGGETSEIGSEVPFIGTLAGGEIIAYTNPSLNNSVLLSRKSEVITYAVQSGDTPSEIAQEFGIKTQTLLWANSLSERGVIRPGDELIILPIDGVRHRVSAGDTVLSIAAKYHTTAEKIIEYNNLGEEAFIREGQYLIIPDGIVPRPSRRSRPVTGGNDYVQARLPAGYFIFPTSGRNWGRLHPTGAVDIANACGTPIYAAASGTVTRSKNSGWNGGFGNYLMIKHPNGVVTAYGHLQKALVGVGTRVNQGDLIAYMGTTGRSTGCHVHFEVRGAANPFARY